eukprot:CAMPEP_0118928644 /NCGR_PEP_ID=MMETSP1169-20130426/5850_1 /TAXON_ID=36882 /ORGANISM="Pyramimonas obovata, Strain CCMP722" /LENGTH=812 /DNA_ID=CAMNT_0006870673 /DNA_START=258 /DNA_END=2696 /DNA_ORIENTATION=+
MSKGREMDNKETSHSPAVSLKGNERLREFVDFLHEHNINQHINLPEIAVMGDTSSGKSSLLSAISQIQLPSNDQLTTRCPLRLHMARSDCAKARVGIKWHSSSDYKDEKVYPQKHLDGWEDIPTEIERAQQCILEQARTGSKSATKDVSVARDIVEVDVFGPECVDLTLIDLPGIVRFTSKNESETLGEDIKALIEEYLKNERCVILAVAPANVDLHNSEIMADARKVDPTTRRTIPVITKPDLIDAGAEQSVLDMLLGRQHATEMGFHMVKCRGQKALNEGKSMQEGMQEEEHFFTTQEPWCKEEARDFFGVPELRKKLAGLQVRMIGDSIPGLLADIEAQRKSAAEELARLGKPFSSDAERHAAYFAGLNAALRTLEDTLSGRRVMDEEPTATAKQHESYTEFRDEVMQQRLGCIGKIEEGSKVIVHLKDGDEVKGEVVDIFTRAKSEDQLVVKPCDVTDDRLFMKQASSHDNIFAKQYAVGDILVSTDQKLYPPKRFLVIASVKAPDEEGCIWEDARWKVTYRQLSLLEWADVQADTAWLTTMIKHNRNNDLPCFLSAAIFGNIVRDMVTKDWRPLCWKLLEDSRSELSKLVVGCVLEAFPKRYPGLRMHLEDQVRAVVDEAHARASKQIEAYLQREADEPYTQNHYLFENIAKKRNQALKQRLLKQLRGFKTNAQDGTPATVSVDNVCELVEGAFTQNERMSCEEHVAMEMQTILQAYGKVASKRAIDEVPMMVQNMRREVVASLQGRLQQTTDLQLREMMFDPSDFTARHARASKKLEDMEIVKAVFRDLQAIASKASAPPRATLLS